MDTQNRLGLPTFGPGSPAGLGRRIAAFFLDYFACWAISHLIAPHFDPLSNQFRLLLLEVLFAEISLFTALMGSSFGQRLLGIQVAKVNLARADILQILGRTALIFLVIPAVIWDRDGRGLHDRLLGTVVVRTR